MSRTIVTIEMGGTGANTAAAARNAIGAAANTGGTFSGAINVATANISTIETGNALTLSTGTASNGNIIFSSNGTEEMRITNTGLIGIFTTTPNSNLTIVGNVWATTGINAATMNATTSNAATFISSAGINVGAQATNAYGSANLAYEQANNARAQANSARDQANTARTTANDAYNTANTRLSTSGGSISGDLSITGNLTVQGNATTINVSNLSVNDSIILLSNGAVGDSTDIGFVGHFDRGPTATHAGLIRKATLNEFFLFDNYEVEPTNNVIDVAGQNFRVGNLRLGIVNANSVLILGSAAATQANLTIAHNQANSARDQANTARSDANTTFGTINTTFATLNTSAATQNTNIGNAYDQANSARGQANTAYGQANLAYAQANSARSDANTTFATINTTFATINTTTATMNTATSNRVLKAGDTMTGQLNVSSGGLLVTGNVGFGMPSPIFPLQVKTNTGTPPQALQLNTTDWTTTIGSAFQFGFGAATGNTYSEIRALSGGYNAWNNLVLQSGGGNVGIGTTSPSTKLHLYESGATDVVFRLTPANATYDPLIQLTGQGNDINAEGFEIWYDNDVGDVHLSTTYPNDGATIHFHTRTGASKSTSNERLTILGNGNVGIGATNPSFRTEISSASLGITVDNVSEAFRLITNPGGNIDTLDFFKIRDSGGSDWQTAGWRLQQKVDSTWMGWIQFNGSSNPQGISFGAGSSTSSARSITERMRITNAGNVGIGTTNPSKTLTVFNSTAGDDVGGIRVDRSATDREANFQFSTAGANKWWFQLDNNGTNNFYLYQDSAQFVQTWLTNGNVGIGSTNPTTRLDVSGTITCTALTETSSIIYKENVDQIDNALNYVTKLVGVTYDRRDGSAKNRAGFIAEEVEQVLPNVVQKDNEGNPSGIHYTNLIAYLVESIKELKAEIDTLKKQNGTVS